MHGLAIPHQRQIVDVIGQHDPRTVLPSLPREQRAHGVALGGARPAVDDVVETERAPDRVGIIGGGGGKHGIYPACRDIGQQGTQFGPHETQKLRHEPRFGDTAIPGAGLPPEKQQPALESLVIGQPQFTLDDRRGGTAGDAKPGRAASMGKPRAQDVPAPPAKAVYRQDRAIEVDDENRSLLRESRDHGNRHNCPR